MVPWFAMFWEVTYPVQLDAKMDMNLCSLPRSFTIALVKTGGFLTSSRLLRLWPPKCHGPIVEVGSHIIIIVFVFIIVTNVIIIIIIIIIIREFKLNENGKRQPANFRFKLRFSQNRKLAAKNSSKNFLGIKTCVRLPIYECS